MGFLIFWAGCIVVSGFIAALKERSIVGWGFLTIFLGPLGVLWILTRDTAVPPRELIVPTEDDVAAIKLGVGDSVEGLRAHIDIMDNGIKIRREAGTRNALLHGLKGEKSISYRSITAVQLRMPTDLISGYIQLSIAGALEGNRGIFEAAKDENSVLFVDTQSAHMMALRDYLEHRIESAHNPRATASQPSLADELTKLADLRDRGVLSDEEFTARKAALLS